MSSPQLHAPVLRDEALESLRVSSDGAYIDGRVLYVTDTGVGFELSNITLGIRPTTPAVACVPDSQVFLGDLLPGASRPTPPGALTFLVDPDPNGPGRSSSTVPAAASFSR